MSESGSCIYLASKSPRRAQLLKQIGVAFQTIVSAEVDETWQLGEAVDAYVQRLALAKAQAAARVTDIDVNKPILAADTAVALDNTVLGKPQDRQQAYSMLESLSGKTHSVCTAIHICKPNASGFSCLSTSNVTFRKLKTAEINRYLDCRESFDKAGAYAIQGLAAIFIKRIEGSFSGVMGLPLYETAELLRRFNIDLP